MEQEILAEAEARPPVRLALRSGPCYNKNVTDTPGAPRPRGDSKEE